MDFDPRNEPTRWGAHAGFQLPWKTWRIVSVIGVGSFGTVYEVAKIGGAFDERCAVKHISLPKAQTDIAEGFRQGRYASDSGAVLFYQKAKERIINEIQLMQRFAGHSHIVNYHDYEIVQKPDVIGYDIFIRMDLLHSLPDHLKCIPADQMETAVAGLGRDICDGLRAIHRRNILHRDIKPANILYGETGYKLADFGVAKSLDVTGSVTTAGTQNYMSPELYKHQEGVNQTSDIYSLGIVMYRLLNGNRLPFLPADPAVVIDSDMESAALGRRMRGETVAPIGGVNPELMHIIQKACSYHSMDRYQSADEMAAALDQYQRAREEQLRSSLTTSQSEKRVMAEGNHDAQVAKTGDVLETTVSVQNSDSLPVGGIQRNDPLMPASAKMEALNLPPHDGGGVHAANTATQRDAQEGPTSQQTGATGVVSSGATVSAAAEGAQDAMHAGARLAVQLEGVLHKAEGNELEQLAEDGDSIVYTVSVTNEGNDGVYVLHPYFEDHRLNDALPANRTFRLEPGQHWTAEASLRITREDVGKPEILQTVTASGKDSHGTIITAQGHHAARTMKSAFRVDRKFSIGRSLLIIAVALVAVGLVKVIDANLWRPVLVSSTKHTDTSVVEVTATQPETSADGLGVGDQAESTAPTSTLPSRNSANDFRTRVLNDGTLSITKYSGSQSDVVVPQEINGRTVAAIDSNAFMNCTYIMKVTLPNTITSLGNGIFYYCKALKEIQLPSGTQRLGNGMFIGCIALEQITLPDTLVSLGEGTFSGCSALKEITLPNALVAIEDSLFDGCSSLREITLPDTVTSVGVRAFALCKSLYRVTMPAGVTKIGAAAFFGCTALSEITLPDQLLAIEDGLFQDCSSLKNLKLPAGIVTIAAYAFDGCSSLRSINLPVMLTEIGKYAFGSCTSLQEVSIPEGIDKLADGTFFICSSLKKVTLPTALTAIGAQAFWACDTLTSITLPKGLLSIGYQAFDSSPVKDVNLPTTLTYIEDSAFDPYESTLLVQAGSYGEDYAKRNKIPYTVLGLSPENLAEKYAFLPQIESFDATELQLRVNVIDERHAQIALFDPWLKKTYTVNDPLTENDTLDCGWSVKFQDKISGQQLEVCVDHAKSKDKPESTLTPEEMYSTLYFYLESENLWGIAMLRNPMQIYGQWLIWDVSIPEVPEYDSKEPLEVSFMNVTEYNASIYIAKYSRDDDKTFSAKDVATIYSK